MADNDILYPYEHRTHMVYTVGIFGQYAPVICKGPLILRCYFEDNTRSSIDQRRTNESIRDTIFYESNKIIRIRRNESFGERRILREIPFPQFGQGYCLVYNVAEIPSNAHDDGLTILGGSDPEACGLAIILKRSRDNAIEWLDYPDCERLINFLSGR